MIYHICNPNSKRPVNSEDWLVNIESDGDLTDLNEQDDSVYLLNIHLNWGGRPFSGNYGFDVANILRTKKASLAPIIFYSPIPANYFEHKSKGGTDFLKYQILYGRGSAFIEEFPISVPFNKDIKAKLSKDVPRLTPSSLHDVQTMLCDLKGLVLDKLNHNLKSGMDPLPSFAEVEPFLSDDQKRGVDFEANRETLGRAFTSGNTLEFIKSKEDFLNLCSTTLTAKGAEVVTTTALENMRHKVLIVEDNEDDLQKAVSYLEPYFDLISEREAEKAITLLEKDTANEILAVICDWRLYKNGSKYWQKSQGYEVLEKASKTGRALFALTSQADFVVHQIRNNLGFKFQLIKKQDFQSHGHLLVDWIKNACQNNLLDEVDIPTATSWGEYKDVYRELRNTLDWEVFRSCVLFKANDAWAYSLENGTEGNKLSEQFGLGFRAGNTRPNLFSALVLRLIWFGLWHKYGFKKHSLFMELGEFVEYERDGFDTIWDYFVGSKGNPGQMTQDLFKAALTEDDISAGRMFPHERAWLLSKGILEQKLILESKPAENTTNEEEGFETAEEFTIELEAELIGLRKKATAIFVNSAPGEFTNDERIRMNYLGMLAYRSGHP